jgi:hypothetical protein
LAESVAPKEVVLIWNDALFNENYKTVEKYTSRTSSKYMDSLGGISGLSRIYQNSANKNGRNKITIISQSINGDSAIVKYESFYPKQAPTLFWQDTVLLENGIWKLAPQHVKVSTTWDGL